MLFFIGIELTTYSPDSKRSTLWPKDEQGSLQIWETEKIYETKVNKFILSKERTP